VNEVLETDEEREALEREALNRLRILRAQKALEQAPELAMHMRSKIIVTDGMSERGFELPEASTPLHTIKADDADELYARLIEWVTYWSRWLEFMPTATSVAARHIVDPDSRAADPQMVPIGFRAAATPEGAAMLVRLQTMWLLQRIPQMVLVEEDAAAAFFDDVTSLIWSMRAAYGMTPAREKLVSPRRCEDCGAYGVEVSWNSADITDVSIACEPCGTTVESPSAARIERAIGENRGTENVLSQQCAALEHADCESVVCVCGCHFAGMATVGHGEPTPVRSDGVVPRLPASTNVPDQRVCRKCFLYHPEGACQG